MANNVYIGDDVLYNILARLPGKSLQRFRCVSKHWNRLISDPCFIKSRSRRMILLPFTRPLVVIDENVPVEEKAHSIFRIGSPLEHEVGTQVSIVGTLNGIVVLALYDDTFLRCHLILFNPLTGASKTLVVMDPASHSLFPYVFGFGYGATTDDLKIVRLEVTAYPDMFYKCDVFDLKTSSWSTPPQYLKRNFFLAGDAGMFLNGFLYWSTTCYFLEILAFNVKEMVFSKVKTPDGLQNAPLLLGSLDGCLCMINNRYKGDNTMFDVWLMKEHDVWLIVRSFRFSVERNVSYPISIFGDGKVLIKSSSDQLVIYDTSKDSYKALNGFAPLDHDFNLSVNFKYVRSIEYVESLVSPSDICNFI